MTTETETMGRVVTEATLENLADLLAADNGQGDACVVRRVTVDDALVDTGATLLSLPRRLIQELGLRRIASRPVITSGGKTDVALYRGVQLTIQGRSCIMDVLEAPDDVPVLIGQIPLEHLDFIVDLRHRTLVGNPAHGGEHVYELY